VFAVSAAVGGDFTDAVKADYLFGGLCENV
jgi:hypothetical protein